MLKTHPFTEFPVHLYHKAKAAIMALDPETLAKAVKDGYSTEYQHQEYPKTIHLDGGAVTVNSPEEEKLYAAKPAAAVEPAKAAPKPEAPKPEAPKQPEVGPVQKVS